MENTVNYLYSFYNYNLFVPPESASSKLDDLEGPKGAEGLVHRSLNSSPAEIRHCALASFALSLSLSLSLCKVHGLL